MGAADAAPPATPSESTRVLRITSVRMNACIYFLLLCFGSSQCGAASLVHFPTASLRRPCVHEQFLTKGTKAKSGESKLLVLRPARFDVMLSGAKHPYLGVADSPSALLRACFRLRLQNDIDGAL